MRTKTLFSILIVFFLVLFFFFYKGLQNPNFYTPSVEIKKDIPNFEAKLFNTNELIFSEKVFKSDKFYLINIWSSWCVPCRDEHSFLLRLRENVDIIGLNYKDKIVNAKKFLNEFNSPYKLIFSDPDGTIAIEWGAFGVPETFLIYNKKIVKKYIGPLNENSLLEIKRMIK